MSCMDYTVLLDVGSQSLNPKPSHLFKLKFNNQLIYMVQQRVVGPAEGRLCKVKEVQDKSFKQYSASQHGATVT